MNLKLFLLNIRSIHAHFTELEVLISNEIEPYDVIMVTETWVGESNAGLYCLSGYNMLVNGRDDGKRTGGVIIYIKENIACQKLKLDIPSICNMVGCRIMDPVTKNSLTLICLYRYCKSTRSTFIDLIELLGRTISGMLLVVGDFNIDTLHVRNQDYINLINSLGMTSLINEVTWEQGEKNSCIDHMLLRSNIMQNIHSETSVTEVGFSDHKAVTLWLKKKYCGLQVAIDRNTNAQVDKQVTGINMEKLSNLLDSVTRADISGSVDESIIKLTSKINNLISESQYTKKSNSKKRMPWASKELIELSNEKRKLAIALKKMKWNNVIKIKYKLLVKKVHDLARSDKRNYYGKLLDENLNNPKLYWSIIKGLGNRTINEIKEINIDGAVLQVKDHTQEVCEHFAKYLGGVCTISGEPLPPIDEVYTFHMSPSSFWFQDISESELLNTLEKLPNKKSKGIDNIPMNIVRSNSRIFSKLLVGVFNESIYTCCRSVFYVF